MVSYRRTRAAVQRDHEGKRAHSYDLLALYSTCPETHVVVTSLRQLIRGSLWDTVFWVVSNGPHTAATSYRAGSTAPGTRNGAAKAHRVSWPQKRRPCAASRLE